MEKYTLTKTFYSRTGNVYQAGEYAKNELPKEAFTSEYILEEGSKAPVEKPVENTSIFTSPKQIEINTKKDNITELKQKTSTIKESDAISINSATDFTLQKINGVGSSLAKKIIDMRSKSPFVDYADLEDRVPLGFGKVWTDFNINFE
jgi:transcriptional accessory protein Tex/SPT6